LFIRLPDRASGRIKPALIDLEIDFAPNIQDNKGDFNARAGSFINRVPEILGV
jgi:hypothetical protein